MTDKETIDIPGTLDGCEHYFGGEITAVVRDAPEWGNGAQQTITFRFSIVELTGIRSDPHSILGN